MIHLCKNMQQLRVTCNNALWRLNFLPPFQLQYQIMSVQKGTEAPSHYNNLELKTIAEIIGDINREDQSVAQIVAAATAQIEALATASIAKLKDGGRIFYIGAGTSGRLGILDASEIPPTYGVKDRIIALIAGGDVAVRNAVENAEDNPLEGWNELLKYNINSQDFLIGIAASGTTPYVIGAIEEANKTGISTGCIVCNTGSKIAAVAQFPVELQTGPEYVTGSTRMKAGTAQKMVLNMISTAAMIQLGKVKGNKMLHMQLTNHKLWNRGTNMIADELNISHEEAEALIQEHKGIKAAIDFYKKSREHSA